MSTSFDAEALQSCKWRERARCAAVGLTIHSAVILTCLLTANPIYKGLPSIFIRILFASVLVDVIAFFCFFYGFQKKNPWFFMPIMIKQGVEAVFRSLMLFVLLILFVEYLMNRYNPQRGYRPPKGSDLEVLQFAYFLPFNIISLLSFVKAFDALLLPSTFL